MAKNKLFCEKGIKRLIIKFHRDIFGKGPEEVWVSINRNIGTFYCSNSLTALEEFILSMPDGEEEIKRLRLRIAARIRPSFCCEVEKICSNIVLDITAQICLSSKGLFGAILFQDLFND